MTVPTVVYLDQNHWVGMLVDGSQASAVKASLTEGVARSEMVVPLSCVHYWETWHRREWQSRHRLAAVMRDVSRYFTVGAIRPVVTSEFLVALATRFGRPAPPPPEAIGWGVRHAFNHPLGRIRLMDPVLDDGGPGEEPSPEMKAVLANASPEAFEWLSLAWTEDDLVDGVQDISMRHRAGHDYAKQQRARARNLVDFVPEAERAHTVQKEFLLACWEWIQDAALGLQIDPAAVIAPGPAASDLIAASPTMRTWWELEVRLLRDLQYEWKQHDLNDLFALSLAAAYCDVIATERHWAHHLRETSVVKERSVAVVSSAAELVELLDRGVRHRSRRILGGP